MLQSCHMTHVTGVCYLFLEFVSTVTITVQLYYMSSNSQVQWDTLMSKVILKNDLNYLNSPQADTEFSPLFIATYSGTKDTEVVSQDKKQLTFQYSQFFKTCHVIEWRKRENKSKILDLFSRQNL